MLLLLSVSVSHQCASSHRLSHTFYTTHTHTAIAVFMPCFMSQSPAGMQIYLCTSFLFTLGQGAVLRNNTCRQALGLPKLGGPPPEGDITKEFIKLKQLERKAQEERGNGPLLGRGVLAVGLECSFAGTNRPSSIIGTNPEGGPDPVLVEMLDEYTAAMGTSDEVTTKVQEEEALEQELYGGPYIHGISAPREEMMERKRAMQAETVDVQDDDEYMPVYSDDVMEAANRGERPVKMAPIDDAATKKQNVKLDARSLARRKAKKRGGKSNRRRKK